MFTIYLKSAKKYIAIAIDACVCHYIRLSLSRLWKLAWGKHVTEHRWCPFEQYTVRNQHFLESSMCYIECR